MPQPSFQEVHVNAPLSNISIAFLQDSGDYIADKVFPVIPVQKASNIYFSLDKGFWFRDEAGIRVDGEESVGSGYGVSQKTYSCDAYALHFDVGPQVRANTDNPLDADTDATLFLMQRLAITRERKFLDQLLHHVEVDWLDHGRRHHAEHEVGRRKFYPARRHRGSAVLDQEEYGVLAEQVRGRYVRLQGPQEQCGDR